MKIKEEENSNNKKKAIYSHWLKKKINQYSIFHLSLKEYKYFKIRLLLKILLFIMIEFILFFIFVSFKNTDLSFLKNLKEKNNIIYNVLFFFSLSLLFFSLLLFLTYFIYIFYFFYTSYFLIKETKEFKNECLKYNTYSKIKNINKKDVKMLYKMKIIKKEILNIYKLEKKKVKINN
ncbi:MAG: hypothetical protein LBF02_02255 [Mycoplasmataceae bacterium]|jgi:hypothetical protein|nr:hypothetical protein [Mycoplasmataceae bacterium]